MTLYTLRVTYTQPNGRVKVRNVRDLTWQDTQALQLVLHSESSTVRTDTTCQTYARR